MSYVEDLKAHILALQESGMAQAEIARRAGVLPQTVNQIVQGRVKSVDVTTYFKILGVQHASA